MRLVADLALFTALLLLLLLLHSHGLHAQHANVKVRQCEAITIDMCRDLGYNETGMPNYANQEKQEDALREFRSFTPLINTNCSSQLRFFLCSVYAPMCTPKLLLPIGPCRGMCLNVRARCEPIMRRFSYSWPPFLNCSKFPPTNNDEHMCMPGPAEQGGPLSDKYKVQSSSTPVGSVISGGYQTSKCAHVKNPESYYYNNQSEPVRCSLKCDNDDLFKKEDKKFSKVWIAIWASLCFGSTLFAVLTFLVDPQRFHYPERVVILLSFCYNLCSIAYIVRLIAGRDAIACEMDKYSNQLLLISEGFQNTNCTIVFLFLYYFQTASYIWWLLLSLTWFLAAGLKWSHEAISRHSSYFHLIAWGLPAILTIVILVLRYVDADELTGMCYIGYQNPKNLLIFVMLPISIFLLAGTGFLLAGFIGLFRIKKHLQSNSNTGETDRLELLMVRIGIFSVVYTITGVCQIACYIYEYVNHTAWHNPANPNIPNLEIYLLKIFMSLVVGLATGIWMCSEKTLKSWRAFFHRLCGCGGTAAGKDVKKVSASMRKNCGVTSPPPPKQQLLKKYPHYQYHPTAAATGKHAHASSSIATQANSLQSLPPYMADSIASGFASPPPSLVRLDSTYSTPHKEFSLGSSCGYQNSEII